MAGRTKVENKKEGTRKKSKGAKGNVIPPLLCQVAKWEKEIGAGEETLQQDAE